MTYDDTGVRCTMLRAGTSRGLYFEAKDLPAEPARRDDLLLRLVGTPDPRQIDGLGGATSLTSKVAVVSPSEDPEVDVDYLFLQLGVDEATVSDRQNCGNILAGVGPFAVERGLVPAGEDETSVRIRMVNSDSVAVATFPTPGRRVEYRGDVAIAGVPGTAAPVVLAFTDTEGSATGSLFGDERRDEFLEAVRGKFREGVPVTFVADIVTATEVQHVIVETLEFRESARRPDETHYLIVLRESPPPPPAGNPLGAIDTSLLAEAGGFLDTITGALDVLDGLGSVPDIADPTPPISGALDGVTAATSGVGDALAPLTGIFA